jgi:hypothetical protein
MRTSTNTALRYLGGITITSSLLLGLGVTAASADAPAADSADCQFGEHLVELWSTAPTELRDDVTALRALPEGERRAAARDIRDGVINGEYGTSVQENAQKIHRLGVKKFADLPDNLRADLKDVKSAAEADRRDMAKQIAEGALAGEYGPRTQEVAERIQSSDAWQNCVAG